MFALRGDARASSRPFTNDRILRSERGNQNAFPRFSGVCRASVRRPRRRRTLKRDEHGARFFLHQEMRRLACVPTKAWLAFRRKMRTGTSKAGPKFTKEI